MSRLYVFILFFTKCICVFSQHPVTLKFDSSIPANSELIFYSYNRTKLTILKLFSRGTNDSVLLTQANEPGLYLLTVSGSMSLAEFIYNPDERITLEVTYGDLLSGHLIVKNSKENICYEDIKKINAVYDPVLDSLQLARMSIPVTTPDYTKQCNSTDSLFEKIAREKNARLTPLQFYYPRTYSARVLVPFYLIPVSSEKKTQTPYAYIAENYFQYAKKDELVLHHPALYEKINRYFEVFTQRDDESIKKSISTVTSVFSADTAVATETTRFMVQSFINEQLPKFAWYALSVAKPGYSIPWVDAGQNFTENFNHVKKGNVVDDIVLNDINGNPVSLSQTCKKNKQTVLIFWNADNRENDSLLLDIFDNLRKEKANVFAVYVGDNSDLWKTHVLRMGINHWVNVSELKTVNKSPLVQRFLVTRVPTVYFLDSERRIR